MYVCITNNTTYSIYSHTQKLTEHVADQLKLAPLCYDIHIPGLILIMFFSSRLVSYFKSLITRNHEAVLSSYHNYENILHVATDGY